jgi:hypothetical protein
MSRVIGFVVCGFALAGCSAGIPGLDFLKSSPATTALRFESAPPGAEVKVSGRTCRTPCELKLEVAELSVTFTRRGYQPQTILVHPEGGVFSAAQFAPNPVHADLLPAVASAKNRTREKVAAGERENDVPTSSNLSEATPSANSTAWTPADVK